MKKAGKPYIYIYILYIFIAILSIPNTIRFNFHYFGLFKFYVFVSYKVKLEKLGDKNSIICKDKKFMGVILGLLNGSFNLGNGRKSYFYHERNSKIIFGKNISISNNFQITVNKDSKLEINDNVRINSNCILSCDKEITIGKNTSFGWNSTIIDGDGHSIYQNNEMINYPKPIHIGENVWIASNVFVLKGSTILDNSIVALGAVVCKKFEKENVLIACNPSKIIKENVSWKKEWIK